MFDIKVSEEQYQYALRMVEQYNFGQRGYGDGNKREQETGIIGQTVFADAIGAERPNGAIGFDGGKDFIINQKRVDIKTMTRSVSMKNYFVHNFIGYQKDYEVDYYVFASLNTNTNVLTICGFIDKSGFFKYAKFYPKGSIRKRSDGTTFKTFAPLYEIKQIDLYPINDIEKLIEKIL